MVLLLWSLLVLCSSASASLASEHETIASKEFNIATRTDFNYEAGGAVSFNASMAAWLRSLEFSVHQTVTKSVGPHAFNFTILGCGNITLGGIDHGADLSKVTLKFGLTGVGLTCHANWSLDSSSGSVEIAVSNTATDATLKFAGAPDFPTAISLAIDPSTTKPLCSLVIPQDGLQFIFDGGLPAPVVKILEALLDTAVRDIASTQYCTLLDTELKTLTPMLHNESKKIDKYTTMAPSAYIPPSPDAIALNTTKVLGVLRQMLENSLMDTDGPHGVNTMLHRYEGKTFAVNLTHRITIPNGSIDVSLSNVQIHGLTSVNHLDILDLLSGETLGTTIGMGPLQINSKATITLAYGNTLSTIPEAFDVSMEIKSLKLKSNMYAQVHEMARNYTDAQWSAAPCIAQAFSSVGLQTLDNEVHGFSLNVTSIAQSGLAHDIVGVLDDTTKLLFANATWGNLMSSVLAGVIGGPVRDGANLLLTLGLAEGQAGVCAPDNSKTIGVNDGISNGFLWTAGALVILSVVAASLGRRGGVPVRCFGGCLGDDPAALRRALYAIPLVMLAVICMYVSEKAALGDYSVERFHGSTKSIDIILESSSFFGVIQELWTAHMYSLAASLITFSFAWPIIRIFLLAFCWLSPRLSSSKRGKMAWFLDETGKWMFLDTMAVILLHTESFVKGGYSSAGYVSFVEPKWGYHGLTIANMGSMLIGHFVREMHRRTEVAKEVTKGDAVPELATDERAAPLTEAVENESLASHAIASNATASAGKAAWIRLLVPVLLVVACAVFLYGWVTPCANFSFHGPEGFLLKPQNIALSRYVLPASGNPDTLGNRWIQVTFLILTLVPTMLDLTACMVLWVVPMGIRPQTACLVARRVFHCWSCVEVMLLELLLATDNPKDNPDRLMQAIGQQVKLLSGFGILFLAVLLTGCTGAFVERACDKVLQAKRRATVA